VTPARSAAPAWSRLRSPRRLAAPPRLDPNAEADASSPREFAPAGEVGRQWARNDTDTRIG